MESVTWWGVLGYIGGGVVLHGGVLGYMVESVRLHGGKCCITWGMLAYIEGVFG